MAMEIQAPARPPLRYGLFSVAEVRPAVDAHVFMGASWVAAGCNDAGRISLECQPGMPPVPEATLTKDFSGPSLSVGTGRSFAVYGYADCSPVGFDEALAYSLAQQNLLQREEKAVEAELYTGTNTTNAGLVDVAPGAALPTIQALAKVEQYLAEQNPGQGIIHVDRFLGSILASQEYIMADGPVMRTRLGTPVAVGAGYATPDETPTIYGTGQIVLVRGDIFSGLQGSGAGFNTTNNDLVAVAEREYLLAVDNCVAPFAQLVTL